jgi:PAS domain S-box-containing protein
MQARPNFEPPAGRSRQTLRLADSGLRQLFENSSEGIWVLDLKGLTVEVNQSMANMLGYSPDEMIGTSYHLFLHPDERSSADEVLRTRIEGDTGVREHRMLHRAGHTIWVSVTATLLHDQDNRPSNLVAMVTSIVARKRSDELLRTTIDRLHLLQEAAHIGTWGLELCDPPEFQWSPEMYLSSGFDPGRQPAYFEWLERIHAEDRDRVDSALRRSNNGGDFALTYRLRPDSGSLRWHESRGRVSPGVGGTVASAQGITLDVTHLKKAEEELRFTKDQMQTILEHASDALFIADREGRYVEVNPAGIALLGYAREELLDKSMTDVVPPEDLPRLGEAMIALADGRPMLGEWSLCRKDGARVSVEIHARRLPDGRFQGLVRDITERKRLEEVTMRMAAIVASSEDAIITKDLDGIITSWNKGAERIFGYQASEIVGQPIAILAVPGRTDEMPAILQKIGRGEPVEHFETVRRTKDGREIDISISVSPVRDRTGRIIGASKIARDITSRKAAEQRISELNRDLARRVRELEALLEVVPVGICVASDPECRETQANAAFTAMVGKGVRVFQGEVELLERDLPMQVAAREGRAVRDLELTFVAADGRTSTGLCYGTSLTDEAGRTRGAIGICLDITARKAAEAAVTESRDRLDLALRNIPLLLYTADRALRYTWMYRPYPLHDFSQILGRRDNEILPPGAAGLADLIAFKQRVLDTATPANAQISIDLGCGMQVFDMTAEPLRNATNQVVGISVAALDVTERVRSEQILRATEERQRLAVDAGKVGLWDWDIVADRVAWSERVYEFHGLKPGLSRTSDSFLDSIHPDDLEHAREVLRRCLEEGAPYELEFRTIRPTGEVRWLSTNARLFRDASGKPIRMVGATLDNTTQKLAAEALRSSEDRQWRAVEAGKVGLWEWDIIGDVVTWSDVVYDLHGLPKGSFGGKVADFSNIIHPLDRDRVTAAIDSALSGESDYRAEYRALRPDGETRWILTTGRVTRDASGRPIWMRGAAIDTTERRETEEALRRLNTELEEFAFVASHDLQEPLRMVNIYTQMLLRKHVDPSNAEAAEYASTIRLGVQRMEQLILDLLDYSRSIHDTSPPNVSADLNDALDHALSVLSGRIGETGAIVERGVLPVTAGDTAHLSQVFQNLLANALKYRDDTREPRITVSAERKGNEWIVSVTDNGVGFEQMYSEQIFGLFKRLHKDGYPGTGLGLAVCRRIVERFGGRIWAEGFPGRGAAFHFALPARISL